VRSTIIVALVGIIVPFPNADADGYDRQRGSAGGQMQKISAVGKFHHVASLKC